MNPRTSHAQKSAPPFTVTGLADVGIEYAGQIIGRRDGWVLIAVHESSVAARRAKQRDAMRRMRARRREEAAARAAEEQG